ncbi:MAG: alpha/beta hydrolase [Candidatus Kerfeldbacteria bacterium]|nr:alpha/beta hydrolase [Candidatus Kerfeldbacteria bacterium]
MKTVLFVPGFKEDMSSRDYASTIKAIQKKGYRVEYVPIQWQRTTIEDWQNELETVYKKYDPKQTILAGFSFGAMTAFVVASKKSPSALWLFSLSPYFQEDISSKLMKKWWLTYIGSRRMKAFTRLNFTKLAKKVTCPTTLWIGAEEFEKWSIMKKRARKAHTVLQKSKLVVIEGIGHDVADKKYIEAIVGNI